MSKAWMTWGCLLFAVGCAEAEPTMTERLEGSSWYVETPDEFDCVFAVSFLDDGTYEHDTLCSLQGGGYGMEVRLGKWVVLNDKKRLRLTNYASTCGRYDGDYSGLTSFDMPHDDTLRFLYPEALVVFDRVDGDGNGANGVVRLGCFDRDRVFVQQELVTW